MKNKTIQYLFFLCITFFLRFTLEATSNVSSQFHNKTDFPILFQSFQDQNKNPIETHILESGESFTSKIKADSTVQYRVHANISPQSFLQSMSTGAYNIVYNNQRNYFSIQSTSYQNLSDDSFLMPSPVIQIINKSLFPIYISSIRKDAGQTIKVTAPSQVKNQTLIPEAIPEQAINQTRLSTNAFYTGDDPIKSLTVSSAIKDFTSPHYHLFLVKNEYEIVNNNGSLKLIAPKNKFL